jgi:cytoskeletal protein RodZ
MPSEVRFTRAQKWDLVRISAAAVASTVFFTAPLFLVPPASAPAVAETRASDAQDVPLATGSAGQSQPSEPLSNPSAQTVSNVVSVMTFTEFAIATTPVIQSSATGTRNLKSPSTRSRATAPPPTPSLSRRLGRFIAGNGKYTIKPFPTVNTSGS